MDLGKERDKLQLNKRIDRRIYLAFPKFVAAKTSISVDQIIAEVVNGHKYGVFTLDQDSCKLWAVFVVDMELPCPGYSFVLRYKKFKTLENHLK